MDQHNRLQEEPLIGPIELTENELALVEGGNLIHLTIPWGLFAGKIIGDTLKAIMEVHRPYFFDS